MWFTVACKAAEAGSDVEMYYKIQPGDGTAATPFAILTAPHFDAQVGDTVIVTAKKQGFLSSEPTSETLPLTRSNVPNMRFSTSADRDENNKARKGIVFELQEDVAKAVVRCAYLFETNTIDPFDRRLVDGELVDGANDENDIGRYIAEGGQLENDASSTEPGNNWLELPFETVAEARSQTFPMLQFGANGIESVKQLLKEGKTMIRKKTHTVLCVRVRACVF